MGILGRVVGGIKKRIGSILPEGNEGFVYNLIKPLKKLVPEGQPLFPLKGWRYCGAFNDLDNGPPKNSTDAVCEKHDYAYDNAFSMTDKQEAKRLIREADLTMLEALKDVQPADINERIGWHLANFGINAKVKVEDAGSRIGQILGF